MSAVFVGPRAMRKLNCKYRGKDSPTDVLSFAYGSGAEAFGDVPLLGEVVIAPSVAFDHARRWRTPPEQEVRKLLVHGILHLLGYDHETDNGEMIRMQNRLMRRLRSKGVKTLRRNITRTRDFK
jgi:probable rRNA maturation factor